MAASTHKLADLARKLDQLGSPTFRVGLSRQLAAEGLKLIADGFREERDPYGTPWAPIHRNGRILQDTGRLRASFAPVSVTSEGFRLASNVAYAMPQQYGAHYAARSDARVRTLWQHPTTGRIVGRNTKLTAVIEHTFRATHGERDLVARPMVPTADRGLGPIWTAAFERVADKSIKEALK